MTTNEYRPAAMTPPRLDEGSALLPCPFCGSGADHTHIYAGEEIVRCSNMSCPASPMSGGETEQEAFAAWNSRAALSASKQEGKAEGWMPIETAPKDGREFLCLTETIGCAVIFWDSYEEPPHWANGFDDTIIVPTHWTPLPPAPAAQSQGDSNDL